MVLILESRSHLDLGDLPNMLAAELGVMTVRLERAIRSLDGVARVHVNRWGDGSAHLHVWFLARPQGRLQLRGTFLSLWDEILPAIPDSQWRENLALVAAWLAEFGGRPLAEPPRIDWKAPAQLTSLALPVEDGGAGEGGTGQPLTDDGQAKEPVDGASTGDQPSNADGGPADGSKSDAIGGTSAAGADGGQRGTHDSERDGSDGFRDVDRAGRPAEAEAGSRGDRGAHSDRADDGPARVEHNMAGGRTTKASGIPARELSDGEPTGPAARRLNDEAAETGSDTTPATEGETAPTAGSTSDGATGPNGESGGATGPNGDKGGANGAGPGQRTGPGTNAVIVPDRVVDPSAEPVDSARSGTKDGDVVAAGVVPAQAPGAAAEDPVSAGSPAKGRPRRWRRR